VASLFQHTAARPGRGTRAWDLAQDPARDPAILDSGEPVPEMPDIEAYIEALRPRVLGRTLHGARLANPFLLRTVDPPLTVLAGSRVEGVSRLGKRIVFEVTPPAGSPGGPTETCFLVLHLMIAGRLHWKAPGAAIPRGSGLAAFDFTEGTLVLTEAGKKRRASLHLVRSREALVDLSSGGLEVLDASAAEFAVALRRENHTLKRALTDPGILSGVGNAYSDEILHRARLSPFKKTQALDDGEMDRLHDAAVTVLQEWTERLRAEARQTFPEKVTAFRPDMAVHGRFGHACPVCGATVRRIVYAANECDYCPVCQTEGRILADRSLSRLLKDDWPRYAGDREEPA
jgi:formamidopyrimidine-DNA glycosylase